MRRRQAAFADYGPAAKDSADWFGFVQGDAEQRHRAAGTVREPAEGGDRTCFARLVQRTAGRIPRAAHGELRDGAEQHRGDDADRKPLEAIAAARGRAAGAAARAAADERPTRAEGATTRRAERGCRAQERRNRAGAARVGREGGRACAYLEVQVRVPGEHVARAADAAEQHPDPKPTTRGQCRRQSGREAGRVLAHDSRRGYRPSAPDHRHPRSLQDRVGNCQRRRGGNPAYEPHRRRVAPVPSRGGAPATRARREYRFCARAQHRH